jgi:hypothetical protein
MQQYSLVLNTISERIRFTSTYDPTWSTYNSTVTFVRTYLYYIHVQFYWIYMQQYSLVLNTISERIRFTPTYDPTWHSKHRMILPDILFSMHN